MPSILPKTPQGQVLGGLPLESDAPLIMYIDFKSPYAYLAVTYAPNARRKRACWQIGGLLC